MRRTMLALLCAAGTLGLPASPAAAQAVAPAYTLTATGANALMVATAGGASTLAVDALQVTQAGNTATFSPAATGPLPAGCTPAAGATTCDTSTYSTLLQVQASVVDVALDGISGTRVRVVGGTDPDRIVVTHAALSGELSLFTGRGADTVTISGSLGSLTDTTTSDADGDLWSIDVPGLTGTLKVLGGPDRVDAADTQLEVLGGEGNDTLTSGGALRGEAGDDILRPRTATGVVDGGVGNDRVSYAGTTAPLTLALQDGGSIQVNGAATSSVTGVEGVEGGDSNDIITGDDGANVLSGGLGDDVIQGRGGADSIDGGPGTDTLRYDELPTDKPVTVDLVAGKGGPSDAQDVVASIEAVVGTPGPDVMTGTGGPERFSTGDGTDTVNAGGGDDVVDTGSGAATVSLGAGNDTLVTDLRDVFADSVDAGPGDDTVQTGPGADLLRGGTGDDRLDGGDGADTVTYDERSFTTPVTVALGAPGSGGAAGESDVLLGLENVVGTPGDDSLTGDDGPNALTGGTGNDTLLGRGANDLLDGGQDRDTIDGGAGADTLLGGDEEDRILAFDGFADTVDCGLGEDDAEVDGADTVTGCEIAVRPDRTASNDRDGDGTADGVDCAPDNPAIFPGAVDVPGDAIDQDCSGIDRLSPLIDSKFRFNWNVDRRAGGTKVLRLSAISLPANASIKVSCTVIARLRGIKKAKRGCPFKTKTAKPRGTARTVKLLTLFKGYRLPPGTRVDFVISAPGYQRKFSRFTMKSYAFPSLINSCLPAGAEQPKPCPTRLN